MAASGFPDDLTDISQSEGLSALPLGSILDVLHRFKGIGLKVNIPFLSGLCIYLVSPCIPSEI